MAYKYRSPHARETVYDPEDSSKVLCEFKDHKFETDDKKLAEKLESPPLKYEPWAEIDENDVFILADGSEVAVKNLPEEIRRTILGAPKRLIKKGRTILTGGSDSDTTPPERFVCDVPDCGREFDSQAALNGHKGKHAKDDKASQDEE